MQERIGTAKDLNHETLGMLRIDQVVLQAPGELHLVVLSPRDAETEARLRRLTPAPAIG